MKTEKEIKKPEFFIIGAPKCGTTALSVYLSEHPDIYFSNYKEPNFFNTDFSEKQRIFKDETNYLKKCFPNSNKKQIAGEGTVLYLYSTEAVPNILHFQPNARFIVMLRNPVDLAFSWHSHHLRWKINEDVEDFKTAWNLQDTRKNGKNIPSTCRDPKLIFYKDIALLGEQMKRLLSLVKHEQIKVILYDDFKTNTAEVYRSTLAFLGVKDDNRQSFPIVNSNMKYSNISLAKSIHLLNRHTLWIARIKQKLGIPKNYSISRLINRHNTQIVKRPSLDMDFRKELIQEFKSDIQLLESLTQRDLSTWYK
jgi:hypothetical protein